jgi:isochorismate synthase
VKKELEKVISQSSFDAIVLYRLPHSNNSHLIIGNSEKIYNGINEIHLMSKGFVFEPFDNSVSHGIFIDESYSLSFNKLDKETKELLLPAFKSKAEEPDVFIDDEASYKAHFDQMLGAIKKGRIDKVILSRIIKGPEVKNEQVFDLFEYLTDKYPHAFVYILNTPEDGLWIGAGPELLLKHQQKQLSTVSLAGTIPNTASSTWSEKEIDEQHLVTQFIEHVLIHHQTTNIEYTEAQTLKAGQVQHLCTRFNFRLEKVNGNQVGLLYDLHPTPAVCGMPKEESYNVIKDTEKHDRRFYSGFLGPVNNGDYTFYVNIRCLNATDKTTHLYVGGGLTKDSVVENEWNETELKAQTLLSALKNI